MICPKCSRDFPEKDFLKKEHCFKCVYAAKARVLPIAKRYCRVCGSDLPISRTKYCSSICSDIVDQKRSEQAWFRNINILNAGWH